MVYARRTDTNHRQIIGALRKIGCEVLDLSRVGHGCPDAVCKLGFKIKFMEFKHAGRKPNPEQREWHKRWLPHVVVVETAEQAIAAMCK